MSSVLIIDDEKNIREGLGTAFEMEGFSVKLASSGKEGLDIAAKGGIDIVITDLRMNGITGEEVLRKVTSEMPAIPVIVLTGHGSIDAAVDAMKAGAYDFLTKPLNLDHLIMVCRRALEGRDLKAAHESLVASHKSLVSEVDAMKGLKEMIGKSAALRHTEDMIRKVAPSKATVLITGESGVGKELVARAIHNLSPRKEHEMVSVNCSALSSTLLESELFGHEKGAFTGAEKMQKGRFELANGSTIFLDEIGEVDLSTQVKLLRVLESRTIERVGGEKTIPIDVRIIAATNRDIAQMVKDGRFRDDLYYRLFVVHIDVPPLRERKDDIPLLAASFLSQYASENDKHITGIDNNARSLLYNYSWPGNIRELRNAIESAVIMSSGDVITMDDLPPSLLSTKV